MSGYTVGLSRSVLLSKHTSRFSGYMMELRYVCPFAGHCQYQREEWPLAASFSAFPQVLSVATSCRGVRKMPPVVKTPLGVSVDNS